MYYEPLNNTISDIRCGNPIVPGLLSKYFLQFLIQTVSFRTESIISHITIGIDLKYPGMKLISLIVTSRESVSKY